MNTAEAIIYSACVQHFIRVSYPVDRSMVSEWVVIRGNHLSEAQRLNIIDAACMALDGAGKMQQG